jgi:hypothetical protein
MSSWSWKAGLAGIAIVAATVYAAAQMSGHSPMQHHDMQGQTSSGDQTQPATPQPMMSPPSGGAAEMHAHMMQMMHAGMSAGDGHGAMAPGGMHSMMGMNGAMSGQPTMPGQDAFGAIQEVVQILEADPATDWSKVNIAALREHLIDMNEVTLHAVVAQRNLDDGVEIAVTGEGRTLDAIKRMVPAHVAELAKLGWDAKTAELPNGVLLTVTGRDAKDATKLKALGFMGIMVQGGHHQPHHLMIARGELLHH